MSGKLNADLRFSLSGLKFFPKRLERPEKKYECIINLKNLTAHNDCIQNLVV